MQRTFEDPDGQRCVITCDEEVIVETAGQVVIHDAWEEHQVPPEVLFERLVAAQLAAGFTEVLPDDLLTRMQTLHGLSLSGRAQAFYASQGWKAYEGKRSAGLARTVSFISQYSIGPFGHEFWDAEAQRMIALWPLCSLSKDNGYEDEQHWLGLDPRLPDGPVYHLYTSNAYEEAFASLDAFLADLT